MLRRLAPDLMPAYNGVPRLEVEQARSTMKKDAKDFPTSPRVVNARALLIRAGELNDAA